MPIFHDVVERPPRRCEPEAAGSELEEQGGGRGETANVFPFGYDLGRRRTTPVPVPVARDDGCALGEMEERPLSREELIERIKRGSSPTWTFKHGPGGRRTPPESASSRPGSRASLLPAVDIRESPKSSAVEELQQQHHAWSSNEAAGMEIERPRSALHSGDFREEKSELHGRRGDTHHHHHRDGPIVLATSPVAPWHNDFPPFLAARGGPAHPRSIPPPQLRQQHRIPTQPSSLSSQFVLMPPTSPLVQATYNSDLEESAPQDIPQQRRSRSPRKDSSRRHTFSPQSLQAWGSSMFASQPGTPRPLPTMRRESTFPYQAHQPRRSVTSVPMQLSQSMATSISASTPQTPLLRPRGLSNASESSPLHHAPMVGSYEESILRGRMSTTPSRPLNFVAQIGVLGKGKCKASLRCPPHAHVPFPAVFYSYGSGSGGRITDNSPSPYVGLIDLENNIPPPQDARDESRRRRRYASPTPHADDHDTAMSTKRKRLRKRSQSPNRPPGGAYRIPQQGQLQIIIKNPNKTAVKLFLVPYDLSDMEPHTKTFIRQRSYSAGPIIDMPLSARRNLGTDRPEASLVGECGDPRERPVLRYLVHLHICCTGRGRYWLYKSVRVVFANRVPDGKEKLRNEIQCPEPKYSTYKPERGTPATTGSRGLNRDERAARRRSTPWGLEAQMSLDDADGMGEWSLPSAASRSVKPVPFLLNRLETVDSRPSSSHHSNSMDLDTENPFMRSIPTSSTIHNAAAVGEDDAMAISPTSTTVFPTRSGRNDPNSAWEERRPNPLLLQLEQQSREGFSLTRNASPAPNLPGRTTGEGLLARQLRGLSVERETCPRREEVEGVILGE